MPIGVETLSLEDLERQVRALAAPQGPADLFKTLLDAVRLVAPRGSLYLIRKDQIRGWGAFGFSEEAARALRGRSTGTSEGWLGNVTATEWPLYEPDAADVCPRHGQPIPSECAGMAIRVKDRPIGLVVVERQASESPWHPALLSVLVRIAQLQFDLDVLRRKLGAGEPDAAAPRARHEGALVDADSATAPHPQPASQPPAISPADDPGLEAVRRYARLVATDIRLYNEEAVLLGRRHGDLVDRLADQLTRGKEAFLRRHGPLGRTALEILRSAYVEVLAGGDETLVPRLD